MGSRQSKRLLDTRQWLIHCCAPSSYCSCIVSRRTEASIHKAIWIHIAPSQNEKKRIPLLVQEHKANSFWTKHHLLWNEMWVGSGISKQSFGWLTRHWQRVPFFFPFLKKGARHTEILPLPLNLPPTDNTQHFDTHWWCFVLFFYFGGNNIPWLLWYSDTEMCIIQRKYFVSCYGNRDLHLLIWLL